jgi:hypothetical protein
MEEVGFSEAFAVLKIQSLKKEGRLCRQAR